MPIYEDVCLRSLHRSILILSGLSLLTGCFQLDRRDALPATALGLVSLSVALPVSSGPLMTAAGEPANSLRSPVEAVWQVSSVRLVQDAGGSILILSDRRSGSLLQGLDPSLIQPAVRPFLFPSCDAFVLP